MGGAIYVNLLKPANTHGLEVKLQPSFKSTNTEIIFSYLHEQPGKTLADILVNIFY